MKKLVFAFAATGLVGASAYAIDSNVILANESAKAAAKQKTAQKAAETLIKSLYGRAGEPVASTVIDENKFLVTIGDGALGHGAAAYRVEFRRLNLSGAKEGERVADIRINYVFGN